MKHRFHKLNIFASKRFIAEIHINKGFGNTETLDINNYKKFSVVDLKTVYVADENFETDFMNKSFKSTSRNHKIVKYILSRLERYRYRNEISSESDLYSVEHILPENADETWGDFTTDSIERCKYRLGNLTLLEKKLNNDAGTGHFDEKKKNI